MTTFELDAVKRAACNAVDAVAERLVDLSHDLHAHPELAGREWRSCRRIVQELAAAGLPAEPGTAGLPTAFRATVGRSNGPHVIVCCEYDALPRLGHACGHNVIAAAGVGAGIVLAALVGDVGGRITVLGTPAEERLGGKVVLAQRGAFTGADAVLLIHPSSYETATPRITAAATLEVAMTGRAAHASLFPERGVNALDALVLGYVGVAALRQHLGSGHRVHGIILEGGDVPNVVPARATGRFIVRAPSRRQLAGLRPRVLGCFAAGALASGARLDHAWAGPVYAELRRNPALAGAFLDNARGLGRRPVDMSEIPESVTGSTDLGNVSHVAPAIHPMLAISPADVVPHTPGFAAAAAGPAADKAIIDGAKAMAMTALDLWMRPELRAAVHADQAAPAVTARGPASARTRRRLTVPPRTFAGWPAGAATPGR